MLQSKKNELEKTIAQKEKENKEKRDELIHKKVLKNFEKKKKEKEDLEIKTQ